MGGSIRIQGSQRDGSLVCYIVCLPLLYATVPVLYATALGRTTSIVRKRSNVNNLGHLDSGSVHKANGSLATVARSLNVCLYFAKSQIVRYFRTILCCHLGCIRSVLL